MKYIYYFKKDREYIYTIQERTISNTRLKVRISASIKSSMYIYNFYIDKYIKLSIFIAFYYQLKYISICSDFDLRELLSLDLRDLIIKYILPNGMCARVK